MSEKPKIGSIGWIDVTVADAEGIRDFYTEVVGWSAEGCDMGGYQDYNMSPPGEGPVAGVCHARGVNAEVPAQWTIYIVVEDLRASVERVVTHGGEVLRAPEAGGTTALVRDPAGAVFAMFQA